MSSEVTELIAAFRAGAMSLDEVAQRFRERAWPAREAPDIRTGPDLAVHGLDDPDPYVPGSFDDVSAALHRKDLTLAEYEVLAEAAAEGINAQRRS
jgi:hypothetical protein